MGGSRQKSDHDEERGAGAPGGQPGTGGARWEHFQHVADVGIRGHGASPDQAFEQAALALTAVIADPGCISAEKAVDFACRAPDLEILLVDWLNELVFEMATRGMLFSRFEAKIEEHEGAWRLSARAWGEPVDLARHQPAAEVKGATLSELRVESGPDGRWRAQCIVDV